MWNWALLKPLTITYDTHIGEAKHHGYGDALAYWQHPEIKGQIAFWIEWLADEAMATTLLAGSPLERRQIKASLNHLFKIEQPTHRLLKREQGVAELMTHMYQGFREPLSQARLFEWHASLFKADANAEKGRYREHDNPIVLVIGTPHNPQRYLASPPESSVPADYLPEAMEQFIRWFNALHQTETNMQTAFIRAGIVLWYFMQIHPFEDGNGRIARALALTSIAQSVGTLCFLPLSTLLQKDHKNYYQHLTEARNQTDLSDWLRYFVEKLEEAQQYGAKTLDFLMKQWAFSQQFESQWNARQRKAMERMFAAGVEGFQGGMDIRKYKGLMRTSASIALRELTELHEMGALRMRGKGKKARYDLRLPQSGYWPNEFLYPLSHTMKTIIETTRLYIREFGNDDVEVVYAMNSDPQVMKYIAAIETYEQVKAILQKTHETYYQQDTKFGAWAVVSKETHEVVGLCLLKPLEDTGEIEVGYRFLLPHWGKGYATEVAQALVQYGFQTIGLKRIVAITDTQNDASQRVLEKVGLRFERFDYFLERDVKFFAIERLD